jgi:DHA3 family macrolide efflux protein-like MFS transporter
MSSCPFIGHRCDVVTAIFAILPLCFIVIPQPIHEAPLEIVTPKSVFADVVEGYRYVKNWRGMLYLVLTAALLNFLFVPVGTLMPLVVTQYFHGDVWKLSLLESLVGIGIVLGGLTLGVWGGFKNRMKTSLTGIIGIGLGVFIFGIAPANFFWIAAVGMMVMGFMNPIANGLSQAIMQSRVEPQYQGRVMGMTIAFAR